MRMKVEIKRYTGSRERGIDATRDKVSRHWGGKAGDVRRH